MFIFNSIQFSNLRLDWKGLHKINENILQSRQREGVKNFLGDMLPKLRVKVNGQIGKCV